MSARGSIFVAGVGAVSPAGWDAAALTAALKGGPGVPAQPFPEPGWPNLRAYRVPELKTRSIPRQHPRLRRASAISHFAVSAVLESLGDDAALAARHDLRLGIIFTAMAGSVSYSRRFCAETWENPATASPMLFPETVYNAPASHVGAVLGTTSLNYTLVSDQTGFLQGLALAADWLERGLVDGCAVVGAEEVDWLTAAALKPFRATRPPSEGAGAIYLRREPTAVALAAVTLPEPFTRGRNRAEAWAAVRDQLAPWPGDSLWAAVSSRVSPESAGWPEQRCWPAEVLGEGLAAAGAWASVAAVNALRAGEASAAWVAVAGSNFQAMGAAFSAVPSPEASL